MVVAPAPAGPGALVLVRYGARRCLRGAVLWGYVFGVTVASSALTYGRTYPTAADRRRLAHTFGQNHAASALFGPAPQLQTVAGFTVLKASMTLMIIGAVWGLLTSTRLLRGDEDAGRWEILLTGPTTRSRATAQVLGGLGAGAGVLWLVTALVTVAGGRASSVRFAAPAALFFALALVAGAVMFLAVGAVTSQLAASRRQAAGWAAAALGVSYGIRMVGDAGTGLHWLVWASPLGWVEQLRPLTRPAPWALVPIGVFTALLVVASGHLAGRRDLGAGLVADRSSRPARLGLLFGPTGLAVRLTRSSVAWWAGAMALSALVMGIVARAAGTSISGSSVEQVFTRLGAPGRGTETFLGVAFVILAMPIAFQATSLAGAARAEEAEGRLDHLLAGPVGRTRWYGGRLAVATGALVCSGVATGVFTWVGTRSQGSGVGFLASLEAGLNVVPPAVLVLGVGALALGARPRWTSAAGYVVLGWSALVELLGGFFSSSHWVLDSSLFHQMAAAPAVPPDWSTAAAMAGAGLAAMVLGGAALRRRDLEGP